jgi:hypothetical protein
MNQRRWIFRWICVLTLIFLLVPNDRLDAQVTTATLVGQVRDSSGAVIPGGTVVATHEGTGVRRETVSDEHGEFVMSALPNGPYTIRIELQGFKTAVNQGLQLGAGQTVRQAFTLEVGALAETVTVAGEAPLVDTATTMQMDTIGTQEVRELPVNRRNIANLLSMTAGVVTTATGSAGSGGAVSMNGVGGGGTGITVDGTEANSNPETRSTSQYGSENQIDVMSIESIAEVQVVKGVLAAEYGGAAGGQLNLISRSGTNMFTGSIFQNHQSGALNARDPFLPSTTPKPKSRFNQFGGSLGGPVIHNKLFFFGTYEGYRENAGITLLGTVPNQAYRDEILAALPFPETRTVLDSLPLPNQAIVSAAGVVDPNVGNWRGTGQRIRTENHVVAKSDLAMFNGANLAVTYTRMRPYSVLPRFNVNGSNDRKFPNEQDRVASQFVMARKSWVSESRFGWNRAYLARLDEFLNIIGPNQPAEVMAFGRRMPAFNVAGSFATPRSEIRETAGKTYSLEQKFSRGAGRHFVKLGFRWVRQTGNFINPENPSFTYQTKADLLANIPSSLSTSFGAPPHRSHIDEWGSFLQDDWRLGSNLVLNLGLRYDYYGVMQVYPTTPVPAEIVNLAPATDLRKMDFGEVLDPLHPYNADKMNLGPRAGFAWTINSDTETVLRGGVGVLHSPHIPALLRQGVADPYVPFRVIWNRTELAARNAKWPMYTDDSREIVLRDAAGRKSIFSIFNTDLPTPYTVQSMLSLQRAFGKAMAIEVGFVRTDGSDFPLQRPLPIAFDRQTGARPNPALGAPGGYYVDSSQTMVYNGLQTTFRKRFSQRYSFDLNYTFAKAEATQGGDLAGYWIATVNNTQDFWDPERDRGPANTDVRHRMNASVIYELSELSGASPLIRGALGGWQISGVFRALSGGALTVVQPSGIANSRPDLVSGVDLVADNWGDTLTYLNTAAFARVPVSSVTNATLRPGSYMVGDARGPGEWTVNMTIAKNFGLGSRRRLQVRADAFNAFNHRNLSNPIVNMNSADFGRIVSAGPPRTMQVGARFSF